MATCNRDLYSVDLLGVTSPLHWRVAGINMAYMAVCAVCYFMIAVLIDYTLSSSWYRALAFRLSQLPQASPTTSFLDDDVLFESDRVINPLDALSNRAYKDDVVTLKVKLA